MNGLIKYYQKELVFLKKGGEIFTKRFPKLARRLGFIDGVTQDPHVERVIESFALLTARIHQRLDEDMPELTEALLSSVAPHFLRTMPSMCIVEFREGAQANGITKTYCIQAGKMLRSRPVEGTSCPFKTVYPVNVSPISLENAFIMMNKDDLKWHLKMDFITWASSELEKTELRFYLNGPGNAVSILYGALCADVESVITSQDGGEIRLNSDVFKPVGFFNEQSFSSADSMISPVHTLLQEYFFFPEQFHFIDLDLPFALELKGKKKFTVDVIFKQKTSNKNFHAIEKMVDKNFFKLNCTPAINIFHCRAEPFALSDKHAEYAVIPDVRRQGEMEVLSIKEVTLHKKNANNSEKHVIPPLFGMRNERGGEAKIYWQCLRRRTGNENSESLSCYLSFSDRTLIKDRPEGDIIIADILCTNHHIPSRMNNGSPEGDFECDLPFAGFKVTALHQPCSPTYAPSDSNLRWQLISQFSLNQIQLNGQHGVQRLRDTLRLYNRGAESPLLRLMDGLQHVESKPITTRLQAHDPRTLARGISVTLTFSKETAEEPEYYFLCSLLDHYLGLFAPVNSFTRLTTCVEEGGNVQLLWPVRAGKLQWI